MAVSPVQRLASIRLNSRDPQALADFFVRALGFRRAPPGDPARSAITLNLGPTCVDIAAATPDARDYPPGVTGRSRLFQHFAIVTGDMPGALRRLEQVEGWRPISVDGPEQLPQSSGGVLAFKFRDPEGHPLELIHWPDDTGSDPRIDHSAITVTDTARSVAFYQSLGFRLGARSLNRGPEQSRLDGLQGAQVEVSALLPTRPGSAHVELLCYRGAPARGTAAGVNDIVSTRLVLTVDHRDALAGFRSQWAGRVVTDQPQGLGLLLRDPDGHLLQIEIEP